ncbi:MAG: NAD(P)(+) transhydrogenase (Re/Si-specific) subunit beta [Dehalococcoidia bacterium]|nr:NAD(P)(+) transhydrogenase (Re/Si-specific) subunit beta [Dehalococcoidia bacterium]
MEQFALYLYVLAIALFILSLRWMSEVRTSRRGNIAGVFGMAIAITGTLIAYHSERYDLLIGAFAIGAIIGVPIALKLPMSAVPQRTAMSHAFGSLSIALVGVGEYLVRIPGISIFDSAVLSVEIIIGFLTFTGSCIAFAKLQGLIPGKPWIYPGRVFVTLATLVISFGLAIYLVINPDQTFIIPIMAAFALIFGFLMVMSIGGADMPTVIAILNAYAGLSAAALGFVLDNKVLIVAGALDGASGLILAIVMSKAMNRSFLNVLFGGVGAIPSGGGDGKGAAKSAQSYAVEDVATVLENASSVVVVPGYGMAVAQAQYVVKELADILQGKGVDIKYAVHPVAGRMPGHMNVLLAEAEVSYDQLWEMERINSIFPETDVSIVVGANDVTNPAARTDPESPLYGMPILDTDKSRTVVFIKRSTAVGFAGVDNELFYMPNTMMVFGDAKQVLTELVATLKG